MSKDNVDNWTIEASFVCDCGDCLSTVEVAVGHASDDDKWYLRTSDDAGGADEAPSRGYKTREAAVAAAEKYAAEHDDGNGEDAETVKLSRLEEAAGETSKTGEWCSYWETALDDEGPRGRYETQGQAEAAVEIANIGLHKHNPGPLMCAFTVRRRVNGKWVSVDDE